MHCLSQVRGFHDRRVDGRSRHGVYFNTLNRVRSGGGTILMSIPAQDNLNDASAPDISATMGGNEETGTAFYTNRYKLNLSSAEAARQIVHNISHYRTLIWQYIRRDFVASYKGSILGVLWKFILPLVPMSVYIWLHVLGVFRADVGMPRAIYVVAGLTFWELWAGSLQLSLNRLQAESNLIKKVRVPLIVVYLTGLGQLLFDTSVRLVLLIVLLLAFSIQPSWSWLLLPVLVAPLLLLGMGLGILLSFFAVFTQDVRNIVTILVRYGMFVSAVIFPLPMDGFVGSVILANPLYHLVNGSRSVLVHGTLPSAGSYALCVAASVVICLFAFKKTCSMEERLAWAL